MTTQTKFQIRIGFMSVALAIGIFHTILLLHGFWEFHIRCMVRGIAGLTFACALAAAVATKTE